MPPTFLDAQGLADRLEVSYGTLLEWVRRGKIPCIRDGRGRYLFNLTSVVSALRNQAPKSNGRHQAPPEANHKDRPTANGLDSTN
jgi:excisionase family DNA binding protein